MKVKVFLAREKKNLVMDMPKGTVSDVLKKLSINPESVIIAKGKDLVTEVEKLRDGLSLKIIHIKVSE